MFEEKRVGLDDLCFEYASILTSGKPGVYLEVGANDGVRQSNTLRLEKELKWSGILIEPSVAYLDLVKNRGRDNFFSRNALVSDDSVSEIEGLFSGSLTDSADQEINSHFIARRPSNNLTEAVRRAIVRARKRLRKIPISPNKTMTKVPATTLSKIVYDSGFESIDLLSLDVEGYELEALKGFDFRVRPRLFVVETRQRDALELASIFLANNYVAMAMEPQDWRPRIDKPELNFANQFWLRFEDVGLVPKLLPPS